MVNHSKFKSYKTKAKNYFQSFNSTIKQLEGANEESKRAAQETERLLQLVQMSQEEQNSKEKTIMDLQQYLIVNHLLDIPLNNLSYLSPFRALKNAQARLKATPTQQAQAQAEVSCEPFFFYIFRANRIISQQGAAQQAAGFLKSFF